MIMLVAGDVTIGVKSGIHPKEGPVSYPKGVAVDPENRIYFSVYYPNTLSCVMQTGGWGTGIQTGGEVRTFGDPSGESYIIQNGNQHVATSDSKTHTALHYFTYDAEGRLVGVYDRAQNKTGIQRDGAGIPLTIVSPYGIRTNLVIDSQNRLAEVRYPDGGYYTFEYSDGGLMTAEIDPMGSRFEHVFNQNGRLTDVSDPEGGNWHYNVIESLDGTTRTELITAEGQKTVYLDKVTKSGDFTSLITGPSGATTVFSKSEDGMTVKKSLPCGSDLLLNYALDPGYGYEYVKSQTLSQPSGLAKTTVEDRLYEDVDNDRVHDKATTTITVNGKAFVHLTDGTQNQKVLTTPMGRVTTSGYDPDTGLTTWTSIPGLLETDYTYNTRGRLINTATGVRQISYAYDIKGNLYTITDSENRTTTFDYDLMGRLIAAHRPDSSTVRFDYDLNGNMTVLTNSNFVNHGFDYNSVNRNTAYQTPLSGSYAYIYDRDRRLITTRFPSGKEINNNYDIDNPGRLIQVQTPEGNIDYTYYPCGEKVESIIRGSEKITYGYDGSLVTSKTFTGTLNKTLAIIYNNEFKPQSITYSDGTEAYTYDNDGLLTGAGCFTIIRNAENGLPESVTAGAFTLSCTYNGYGETEAQSVGVAGQGVCSWNLVFDNTGRITGKTETVNGVVINHAYTYDAMGRLLTVSKDGSLIEEYRYNANGSRIYEMNAQRGIAGRDLTYSDEDHLLTAGGITYQYNPDGFLRTRTDGQDVTTYDYSSRGELYSVTLPDGTFVEYIHDPLGRRIAKKINGVIVEKYLWSGMTRLLAVYDGSGSLKMRFEYAGGRMPYAMTKNGTVYYLTSDQVGSLRAIADGSGNVIKRIDYDSFGNIIADSNPNFEVSFGFAGGLHDRNTGLVRFGYRDYDPETGRWTAKDPILFAGGDTDLYGYCLNNPLNWIDPWGLLNYNTDDTSRTGRLTGDTLSFADCMEKCAGFDLTVTGGSEKKGHGKGSKHYTGEACDFSDKRNPKLDEDTVKKCWEKCKKDGYFGQKEGGSNPHWHFQIVPGKGGATGLETE